MLSQLYTSIFIHPPLPFKRIIIITSLETWGRLEDAVDGFNGWLDSMFIKHY